MSTIIQNHFSDLEDITEDEFKQFFKLYGTTKEGECLDRDYKSLQKANEKVSFADLSEHYSSNYNALLELLENTESVRGTLEKYSKNLADSEADVKSCDTFKTNKIFVEFIILLDIYQILKNIKNMAKKTFERKFESFQSFQKYGANSLKIGHLTRTVQQEFLSDELNEAKPVNNNVSVEKVVEAPKQVQQPQPVVSEIPNKLKVLDKLDDFTEKFANLSRDLESIRKELGAPASNLLANNYFPGSSVNSAQKESSKGINLDDKLLQDEKSEVLTNTVWPKSRMLLAIVSKMSKEELLNKEQRGVLKDLIIENDPRILNCLRQYELDGDRKNLYKNCLNLAASIKR